MCAVPIMPGSMAVEHFPEYVTPSRLLSLGMPQPRRLRSQSRLWRSSPGRAGMDFTGGDWLRHYARSAVQASRIQENDNQVGIFRKIPFHY